MEFHETVPLWAGANGNDEFRDGIAHGVWMGSNTGLGSG